MLHGVDLDIQRGEVHALLGENGAGKSTLMKIVEGLYAPDEGEILIDGEPAQVAGGLDAAAHGITMVFQEFSLIPTLSIADNIFLGREPRNRGGFISRKRTITAAEKMLESMGVHFNVREIVGDLPASHWQITEIAKALSKPTSVLVLDEPTASLTVTETEMLLDKIRRLKEAGIAIIYISHRMAEIYQIADRITVLRNGRLVRTAAATEYPVTEVIGDMLGSEQSRVVSRRPAPNHTDPPLLRVRGLRTLKGVNGADLDVHSGEIVGIAGLMGSGRSEFARALFGIDRIVGGQIEVAGKTITIRHPTDAIAAGFALVPEDRRVEGLVLDHSVETNSELPRLLQSKKRWISKQFTASTASRVITGMDVRTSSPRKRIGDLSGGNQQKVVIGKWLDISPRVFILDEPTAGIDIGSKSAIVEKLREYADAGNAVIVISSELDELLTISDRIVIMRGGQIDETPSSSYDSEESLHRAVQGVI